MHQYINEIICGRNEDVLADFPDECIDLTVTSPPYDNLRAYKGYAWEFERTAQQLWRVIKPGGVVVWVVADATVNGSETGTSFRQALYFMECGFNLHDTMIYGKGSYVPLNHNRYEQSFEYMFVFSKGKPNTFNPIKRKTKTFGTSRNRANEKQNESSYAMKIGGITMVKEEATCSNVFVYDVGGNDRTEHNAPFPEKLAEDHILSWSNVGDLVLDPFVGSGTVPKMAIKHHRRFIGIDISEEYCELARRRIGAVQPVIFDMNGV